MRVIDEVTPECLAIEVDMSLTGARVARVLDEVVERRGASAGDPHRQRPRSTQAGRRVVYSGART